MISPVSHPFRSLPWKLSQSPFSHRLTGAMYRVCVPTFFSQHGSDVATIYGTATWTICKFSKTGEVGMAAATCAAKAPQNGLRCYSKSLPGAPRPPAETLRPDGWLHTGDIATMDEDGYATIVDRKKDMILTAGFNVCPAELERVICMHPAVALAAIGGLALALVVGVPLIMPVERVSVSPAGSEPDVTLHVYGIVPPVALSVCE